MLKPAVLAFFSCALLLAAPPTPKGTLVIVGGGGMPDEVFAAFVQASGGKGARIGVVPTASESPDEVLAEWKDDLAKVGVTMVPLKVKTKAEAGSPAILEAAQTCTGFWFSGGDQNRTADAVAGTPLHQLVRARYEAGAAIGGTSAGAAIMSKIMLNGEDRNGKEELSEIGAKAYHTRDGLGFLPEFCIVDQHFLRRNRQNRLFSLIMDHPDHLGLGIDEATALVVKKGIGRVLGNHAVMVFDPRGMRLTPPGFQNMKIHLLGPGQGIELATRKLIR